MTIPNDTMQETVEVLADAELLRAHYEGQAAINAGDCMNADQLAYAICAAGRLER
ncbi:MAG TPA: hypothetical protein VHU91_02730 [Mycobacteriales bacterium]|nr:hypothetical protein [Mycobacteriales bacterium]